MPCCAGLPPLTQPAERGQCRPLRAAPRRPREAFSRGAAPRTEETAVTPTPTPPRGTGPAAAPPPAALRRSSSHTPRPISAGGAGGVVLLPPPQLGSAGTPRLTSRLRRRPLAAPLSPPPGGDSSRGPALTATFPPPRRSRLLLRLPASRPLGRRVRVRHPASGAASAQLGSAHAQWNGAGADRISPRVPGARKREAGERERAAPGGDRKGRAVTGPGAMSQSAVPRAGRMRSRRGAALSLRVGGGSWGRVTRLALPASRLRARGGRAAGPERFRALRRAEIGLRLPGGPPWLGGRGQCQAEGLQHPFYTPSLSTVLSTSPACEGRGYPVCRSSAAVPQVNVRERLSEPYRKPALGLFQTTGFSC